MDYPPLKIENLPSEKKFKVINSGYAFEVGGLSNKATLTGGPLSYKYTFDNLQFHWGNTDEKGSEHQLDGENFSLEAHLTWKHHIDYVVSHDVLKKSKAKYFTKLCEKNKITGDDERVNFITKELGDLYDWPVVPRRDGRVENETLVRTQQLTTFKAIDEFLKLMQDFESMSDPCLNIKEEKRFTTILNQCSKQPITLVAVLAVFFKCADCAPRYDALCLAPQLTYANRYLTLNQELLPQFTSSLNLNQYYTYTGSSSVPPYTTNATWIVLPDPLPVTKEQLGSLRLLHRPGGTAMTNTCREVQDLGGRCLYFYEKKGEKKEKKDEKTEKDKVKK